MIKACEARGCWNKASHSARLINPANGRINQYPVNMCSEHFERVKADGLLAYVPDSTPSKPEETSKPEPSKPEETSKPETSKPEELSKPEPSKPEEPSKAKTSKAKTSNPEVVSRIEADILAAIASHPEGLEGKQIRKIVTGSTSTICDLLVRLEKEGRIRRAAPRIGAAYLIQEPKTSMPEQVSMPDQTLKPDQTSKPEQTSEAERRYLEAVNGRAAALRQTSELEAKLRKAHSRISELERLLAHATAPAIEANTHAMTLDEASARFEAFSAAKRSTARADELRSSGQDGLEKEEVNLLISHHANRADLLMRYALTGKQ